MNAGRGSFAYAQARLQARLGQRADRVELERVRAAGDLAGYLGAARATAWRRHAARLAADLDPHALERHLRQEWMTLVAEIARWQPAPWRDALNWLRWLPYLPALQKLARGGRPPAWTRDDPVLGGLVAVEPALRGAWLTRSPLRPLHDALTANGDVAAAWHAHWRTSWGDAPADARALQQVTRAVESLAATLREAPPGSDSGEPRRQLAQRLQRIFRRHPLSPVAAVAFLGLEALDLLELRGGTLRRATVIPGPQ